MIRTIGHSSVGTMQSGSGWQSDRPANTPYKMGSPNRDFESPLIKGAATVGNPTFVTHPKPMTRKPRDLQPCGVGFAVGVGLARIFRHQFSVVNQNLPSPRLTDEGAGVIGGSGRVRLGDERPMANRVSETRPYPSVYSFSTIS